jgi:hypothetical protein
MSASRVGLLVSLCQPVNNVARIKHSVDVLVGVIHKGAYASCVSAIDHSSTPRLRKSCHTPAGGICRASSCHFDACGSIRISFEGMTRRKASHKLRRLPHSEHGSNITHCLKQVEAINHFTLGKCIVASEFGRQRHGRATRRVSTVLV